MMFGCFYDMKVLFIQSSAFMLAQLVVCPAWQREYSKNRACGRWSASIVKWKKEIDDTLLC